MIDAIEAVWTSPSFLGAILRFIECEQMITKFRMKEPV